jgi:hypothetical protein
MGANTGSQTVTLLYYTEAASRNLNERQHEVWPVGIYRGGYLKHINASTIQLSQFVCEIADSNGYQVRVETADIISISVVAGDSGKYVVLSWTYTGVAADDYLEVSLKSSANILATDLIVGKVTWTTTWGFSYGSASVLYRSEPNTQESFLKVIAPDSFMVDKLKVRVKAGWWITNSGYVYIATDQTPSAFSVPTSGTAYGLVYITPTGTIAIVDTAGNTSVPAYAGKQVIAEIAIPSGTSEITQAMIKDTRPFLSAALTPDRTTIGFNTAGQLALLASFAGKMIHSVENVVLSSAINLNAADEVWTDLSGVTKTITVVSGESLLILGSMASAIHASVGDLWADHSGARWKCRLLEDSTVLDESGMGSGYYAHGTPPVMSYVTPSVGNHTYKLQYCKNNGSLWCTWRRIIIVRLRTIPS